jgi:hypothetical protein
VADRDGPQDRLGIDPRFLIGAGGVVALGLAVLSGVSFSPPALPGDWFSETQVGAELRQEILRIAPNGSFRIFGRAMRDCREVRPLGAAGTWELAGQAVTLRLTETAGAPAVMQETLEIAWLSESRLRLQSPGGIALGGLRVPTDFTFPAPPGCPEPSGPPPIRG